MLLPGKLAEKRVELANEINWNKRINPRLAFGQKNGTPLIIP